MLDRLPLTDAPSLILVVDDEPQNLQVVAALLIKHGHQVVTASSGPEALVQLRAIRPDLILLDVMMPGMTGFELCSILQSNPETRETPIIFLSAAADKDFVIEALQHGGVDYVMKPFHGVELLTRADLHLNLQRTRRRLSSLIEEKNRLLEIVAHDLKNPLNGIQFAALMLAEKSDGSDPQHLVLFESIRDSAGRAFEIIDNLLATPGLDEVKSQIRNAPVCLTENAARAVRNFEQHVRSKEIQLDFQRPSADIIVMSEDRSLLCCLENLISNAIKFSPVGARITVRLQSTSGSGEFKIEDQGPGIRTDEIASLFRKFTRLSARPTAGEVSTGLGLHIVHELISAMQGSVHYETAPHGGACFTVKLPLADGACASK